MGLRFLGLAVSQVKPRPIAPKTAIMDARREEKYRKTFRGKPCEACGRQDDTVVPAHLNLHGGGMGYRVKGAVAALCASCHDIADGRVASAAYDRGTIWTLVCQKLLLDRAEQWLKKQK